MTQALVPLKDLVQAKTRLAGLLRPSERRALAQAMAEDVLSVLAAHAAVVRITLVSDGPGAGLLARKYGADCWPESSLGCRGLNAIAQVSSERLLASDGGPLLILHADLPLLSARDIDAALERQAQLRGMVIGCDRQGTGTNLLAFDAASVPRFRFGANSCAAHLAWAREAGVPVQILRRQGIGLDLDEARDLKYIMDLLPAGSAGHTAHLLQGTELGARVELALATLSLADEGSGLDSEGESASE